MKTRPVLVILITLVMGFVLGMLTSAQIRLHRLKPMRMFFSEEEFRAGFFKTIQPDEKQKAIIEQILNKYATRNSDLQSNFRKELNSNMKDMRKELDQNLTKDQIARLKEMDSRRMEMIRQGMYRHRNDSSRFRRDMRSRQLYRRPEPDDLGTPGGPPPMPVPPPPDNQSSTDSIY